MNCVVCNNPRPADPSVTFCKQCGSAFNQPQTAGYHASQQQQPYQQQHYQQQPYQQQQQYQQGPTVQAIPVQQTQGVYVAQPTVVGVVSVGQQFTPAGGCAHAVQTKDFTLAGICLGILFFPLGILCCLMLTERKCVHCGARFA